MASSNTLWALFVVVLAITASVVESNRCYYCSPTETNYCNSLSSATTCTTGSYCVKMVASQGGVKATYRDCLDAGTVGCLHGTVSGMTGDYCICQGDLCNMATTQSPSGIALGALAGLVVALFMANHQ